MILDTASLDIKESLEGLSFKVKVQPRASRNKIAGVIGDALKLQLTSPPVDGAANEACAAFLSDILGVAKSRVSIIAGEKNRTKVIHVTGLTQAQFLMKIPTVPGK